jgi:Sec7-like guanine-nucleotide exchange factor
MIQRNPKSIATFLKNGPRLDKKLIGDFISKPDNEDILNEFIGLFDFRGVSRLEPSSVELMIRQLTPTFRNQLRKL